MDGQTKADLIRLTAQRQGLKALSDPATPAPVLTATSLGRPASRAGTGGLTSPITEQSRTSHALKSLTSSDGLFTLFYQNVDTITATDATGVSEQRVYANP